MSLSYFVFRYGPDGSSAERMTQQTLEKRLNESYWGDNPKFLAPEDDVERNSGVLIIKGELVIPAPVETVRRWGV